MIPEKRIKVAISACLLGENVRYDGGHRRNDMILNVLKNCVEFVPFCPEMALGMGTPREKIQLERIAGQWRLIKVERDPSIKQGDDFTQPMREYAESFVGKLNGIRHMIVKSRSPSCGYGSTPLFENGQKLIMGSGLFVYTVSSLYPELKVAEEIDLNSESKCLEFVNS